MDRDTLLMLVMPIALGIIMFGLGLNLTKEDFLRVAKFPRAVLVGLFCQLLLLPFICFIVAKIFSLPPLLAVGLMLLSAAPGGAMANLYSHLSGGDVALNVTLTAVNSILSLFTLPLIVNTSLILFLHEGQYIPMQLMEAFKVFAIVLVPVSLGMIIHQKFPNFSRNMAKPVKIAAAILLAVVIIAIVFTEKKNMRNYFQEVGLAALAFNVLSLLIAYFIPRIFKITHRQAIAIGMEIGLHNGTLAIFVALNILHNEKMAVPAAIYSLIMFFTAAIFGWLVHEKNDSLA